MKQKIIHSPEAQRLDFLDSRFYTLDGERFYPSVTHVLDVYPKGYAFYEWLKSVGNNQEQILQKASDEGTKIHNAIEQKLSGYDVTWTDANGNTQFNENEWRMLLRWKDFNESFMPEIIATELTLVSDSLGVGGTIDNVSYIDHNGEKKLWLIDYKSSNMIHDVAEFQLAAYAEMWNEKNPEYPIERCGILHLKAQTRGRDKTGKKIQGEKWQLYEFPRHYKEAIKIFKHLKSIWDEVNPNPKPLNLTLPDRL